MKRFIALVLAVILSFSVFSICFAGENAQTPQTSQAPQTAEGEADSGESSSEEMEAYMGNSDGESTGESTGDFNWEDLEFSGINIGEIVNIVSESDGGTDGALNVVAYIIDAMNKNKEGKEEGEEEENEISGVLRAISELVVAFQNNDSEKIAEAESYLIDSLIQNGAISNLSSEQLQGIYEQIHDELVSRGDME